MRDGQTWYDCIGKHTADVVPNPAHTALFFDGPSAAQSRSARSKIAASTRTANDIERGSEEVVSSLMVCEPERIGSACGRRVAAALANVRSSRAM